MLYARWFPFPRSHRGASFARVAPCATRQAPQADCPFRSLDSAAEHRHRRGGESESAADDAGAAPPAALAHLEALAALADGADIRRCFVWSLLDSFEWELGYGAPCGLVHVDFETQRRAITPSARWYRDFIARARSEAAH
jgi:Glycosyl hydrolase family 1